MTSLTILDLPIRDIDVPEDRARDYDENTALALAASIAAQGLQHPIRVRRTGDRYQLVSGLRRLRAYELNQQANIAMNLSARQIPKFRVTYVGLLGAVTDIGSMPAVAMTGWTKPVAVSKANTTLTLHGWSAVAESLSLDLGNTLTPRHLIGDERILISDRQGTGTAVVEARSVATVDWFARARASTRGALSLVHGVGAGNIVEVTAPAVEIGKPTQGETNNIVNYSLPLKLCPDTGRDELTIIVR